MFALGDVLFANNASTWFLGNLFCCWINGNNILSGYWTWPSIYPFIVDQPIEKSMILAIAMSVYQEGISPVGHPRMPRSAATRKLNDLIKRARLARVLAFLLNHLRNKMPSFMGLLEICWCFFLLHFPMGSCGWVNGSPGSTGCLFGIFGAFWTLQPRCALFRSRQKQGAEEAHRQPGGGVPGNRQGEGTGDGRLPGPHLDAGEVGEDGLHQVSQVGQKDAWRNRGSWGSWSDPTPKLGCGTVGFSSSSKAKYET